MSVLHQDQKDVSGLFATSGAAKFEGVAREPARTGAPVLSECAGWFDCAVHQRIAAGDHLPLVGRIVDFGWRDLAPLAYRRGRYVRVVSGSRLDQRQQWRFEGGPHGVRPVGRQAAEQRP